MGYILYKNKSKSGLKFCKKYYVYVKVNTLTQINTHQYTYAN